MFEAPYIIRMNIRRYQELLKFCAVDDERRPTVTKLLAEAQVQLPLAVAENSGTRAAVPHEQRGVGKHPGFMGIEAGGEHARRSSKTARRSR